MTGKPSHIGAEDSFMAEARRVARLKHPGIVPVHDVGKDGDDFFIISEFVEDGSLGDRLKQGPIPPEQSCRWLAEIADALDYAHKNGVIHRDIKPANILIDHHGRALLADFGIALSANKTGQFAPSIGTLAYMSPEQLEGKPLDPRSDVYSVGVLLCQLLTGKLPYDARDTNSLRKEIVSGAIRLSGSGDKMTPELRGICLKCLAHDPKERYATAKDLANDLRSVQPIKSHRTALVISGIAVLVTLLGQQRTVAILRTAIDAYFHDRSKATEEQAFPHLLITGPAGTGKTLLSETVAREVACKIHTELAQNLKTPEHIHGALMMLEPGDIWFCDEIHELPSAAQVTLYRALEERRLFLGKRHVVTLPSFCLIGATTDEHLLTRSMRDRFRIHVRLTHYSDEEMFLLVRQRAKRLGWAIEDEAVRMLAGKSRGTPRLAVRFLEAAKRQASAEAIDQIAAAHVQEKGRKSFLSVLKEGQSVVLKETAGRYELTLMEGGHKVIEVGPDYVVVEDLAGVTETRISVFSIKSINRIKGPKR